MNLFPRAEEIELSIAATHNCSSLGRKSVASESAQAMLEFAALVTTALVVLFATIIQPRHV